MDLGPDGDWILDAVAHILGRVALNYESLACNPKLHTLSKASDALDKGQ